MTIGDRIKKIAKHRGSAKNLAIELDMNPSHLQFFISDKRKPTIELLIKLYSFGYNINWILTGDGVMLLSEEHTNTTELESSHNNIDNNNDELFKELRNQIVFLKEEIREQRNDFLSTIERLTLATPSSNTVELKNSRRNTRYGL